MNQPAIFHLAIPITNVSTAKSFYCDGLGCLAGRETEKAIILNFYGHQVVAHVTEMPLTPQNSIYPRHFGLILPDASDWDNLLEKARVNQLKFYLEPITRFNGEITERETFLVVDPFINLMDCNKYRHYEAIFASRELTVIGDRA
mgnify:CR=1 FL=1